MKMNSIDYDENNFPHNVSSSFLYQLCGFYESITDIPYNWVDVIILIDHNAYDNFYAKEHYQSLYFVSTALGDIIFVN